MYLILNLNQKYLSFTVDQGITLFIIAIWSFIPLQMVAGANGLRLSPALWAAMADSWAEVDSASTRRLEMAERIVKGFPLTRLIATLRLANQVLTYQSLTNYSQLLQIHNWQKLVARKPAIIAKREAASLIICSHRIQNTLKQYL